MESVSTLLNTKPTYEKEWRAVLARDPCAYCGLPADENEFPEADHIIASAMGGANDPTNLTGACRFCNRSKKVSSLLSVLLGVEIGAQVESYVFATLPVPSEDEITRQTRRRIAAKIAWLPAVPRYEHDAAAA